MKRGRRSETIEVCVALKRTGIEQRLWGFRFDKDRSDLGIEVTNRPHLRILG